MVNKTEQNKFILDACCGRRAMWLNKNHPNTLYIDKRDNGFISPDICMNNHNLKFENKKFKLVVLDPPHILQNHDKELCSNTKYYGTLNQENWKEEILKSFNECWRVLDDYGVLIFKWSNCDRWSNKNAKDTDLMKIFPIKPLFKQNASKTAIWFCFMKIPKSVEQLIATPLNSKGSQEANSLNINLKVPTSSPPKLSPTEITSPNPNK